jgi:3-oxoadipate CoA-transferase beta subunit
MFAETLTRNKMAERVGRDIPDGDYVNLVIDLPTFVYCCVIHDRENILHTESGMPEMASESRSGEIDLDLLNAGKITVKETLGSSYFHQGDSFGMMHGSHLNACVLGKFQVSRLGVLTNWQSGAPGAIPSVVGAMVLAIGAKFVDTYSYPLTGAGCVDRLYTDAAIFNFSSTDVGVTEVFGDVTVDALRTLTGLALEDGTQK